MNNTDTADQVLLLALVAVATCIEALATLLRFLIEHSLALPLTLAGWQPSPRRSAPEVRQQAPRTQQACSATSGVQAAPAAAGPRLEALTVAELRRLARAGGHRSLARSGRRQQLLEALA
jgi:hypothetical protein